MLSQDTIRFKCGCIETWGYNSNLYNEWLHEKEYWEKVHCTKCQRIIVIDTWYLMYGLMTEEQKKEEIKKCVNDPQYFIEHYTDVVLSSEQLTFLKSQKKPNIKKLQEKRAPLLLQLQCYYQRKLKRYNNEQKIRTKSEA
jgi:hypothetical protein